MDSTKYEQLIDLIINENEEQARALFHEIVVEKSREIYESMMDEGDQVGDLLDEISAEEEGMSEDQFDGEEDFADDMGDEEGEDLEFDDADDLATDFEAGEEAEAEDLEDRVVDLEDKLDELIAEFETLMGNEADSEEDFADEEGEEDFADDEEDFADDEEDALAESVEMKKVTVTHGDNGSQTKSPTLTKPKVVATGAKPVSFSQGDEKGRAAPTTQTVGGNFKNAPGQTKAKTETAPKAHTAQATGTNTKSPVAESRKVARKSK